MSRQRWVRLGGGVREADEQGSAGEQRRRTCGQGLAWRDTHPLGGSLLWLLCTPQDMARCTRACTRFDASAAQHKHMHEVEHMRKRSTRFRAHHMHFVLTTCISCSPHAFCAHHMHFVLTTCISCSPHAFRAHHMHFVLTTCMYAHACMCCACTRTTCTAQGMRGCVPPLVSRLMMLQHV